MAWAEHIGQQNTLGVQGKLSNEKNAIFSSLVLEHPCSPTVRSALGGWTQPWMVSEGPLQPLLWAQRE